VTTAVGGVVLPRADLQLWGPATVYEVQDDLMPHRPPTFYFCCSSCGNCSGHHSQYETVLGLALDHILEHKESNPHV
jgi:hypothetical protein